MNKLWPIITEQDKQRVMECLDEGRLWRGDGKYLFEFEESFAKLHGVNHCLAVTNGTHSIELALEALGVGYGDEVLIPAYTFIATATAVLMRNAIPVPVEISEDTFCLDASRIEEKITAKTKAIIPVHISGHACDMDVIMSIARQHGLYVIEDCAHSHASTYKGKPLGSIGDVGTFSFQASKTMTAGEGGAFITNNKALFERAFLIFNCGRPMGPSYDHLMLASNYRMSEIQAALLVGQIDRLPGQIEQRDRNVQLLNPRFEGIEGIIPQHRAQYATVQGYSMYMFRYRKEAFNGLSRDRFIAYLTENGFPAFRTYPVFFETELFRNLKIKYPQYREYEGDFNYSSKEFPVSKRISEEVIWLPHYYLLGAESEFCRLEDAIKAFAVIHV